MEGIFFTQRTVLEQAAVFFIHEIDFAVFFFDFDPRTTFAAIPRNEFSTIRKEGHG